jgi:hypothetical protein
MAGRSGVSSETLLPIGEYANLVRPATSLLAWAVTGLTQSIGGINMPYEKAHPESLYSVSERKITDIEKQLDEVAVVSEALYLVKSSVQDMVDNNKPDPERLSAASFAMGIFQTNLNNAVKVSFSLLDTMRVTPKRGAPKKTIENNPNKG